MKNRNRERRKRGKKSLNRLHFRMECVTLPLPHGFHRWKSSAEPLKIHLHRWKVHFQALERGFPPVEIVGRALERGFPPVESTFSSP